MGVVNSYNGFTIIRYSLNDAVTIAYRQRSTMNIFRVHFTWKEKEYELKARSLDMTHPYFVSIKDLVLPADDGVLINPADDEIRKNFADVRQLMLPFQSVSLIEEFTEDPDTRRTPQEPPKGEVVVTDRFKKRS